MCCFISPSHSNNLFIIVIWFHTYTSTGKSLHEIKDVLLVTWQVGGLRIPSNYCKPTCQEETNTTLVFQMRDLFVSWHDKSVAAPQFASDHQHPCKTKSKFHHLVAVGNNVVCISLPLHLPFSAMHLVGTLL